MCIYSPKCTSQSFSWQLKWRNYFINCRLGLLLRRRDYYTTISHHSSDGIQKGKIYWYLIQEILVTFINLNKKKKKFYPDLKLRIKRVVWETWYESVEADMDEVEDIMDAGLIGDPNLSLGITWPLRTLDWPSTDLPGRSCERNPAEESRKETVWGLLWLSLAGVLSLFSVSTNPGHEYKPPGALRQRRSSRVFVWNVHSYLKLIWSEETVRSK